MSTWRRSPPRPTMICLTRSWVSGRANFTPASSMAMALASAGPIQMGSTRSPSFSWRITTGVLVVRSSPRCATRTSIMAPSGARLPRRQVLLLLRRERVDDDAHGGQLGLGHPLIDLRGDRVYRLRETTPLPDQMFGGEGLVGKRQVHHARRMSFRGRQVDEP